MNLKNTNENVRFADNKAGVNKQIQLFVDGLKKGDFWSKIFDVSNP